MATRWAPRGGRARARAGCACGTRRSPSLCGGVACGACGAPCCAQCRGLAGSGSCGRWSPRACTCAPAARVRRRARSMRDPGSGIAPGELVEAVRRVHDGAVFAARAGDDAVEVEVLALDERRQRRVHARQSRRFTRRERHRCAPLWRARRAQSNGHATRLRECGRSLVTVPSALGRFRSAIDRASEARLAGRRGRRTRQATKRSRNNGTCDRDVG